MLLFICPFLLIPIALGLALAWSLWAFLTTIFDRIRGPKIIYTPKKDSTELIEAVRSGYSPQLGLELNEIFPEAITGPDIDRLLSVREKLFPREFSGFFYSVDSQDLTPAEFKALALRLFLEMAFVRSYLKGKSSRLWPEWAEEGWIYHAPKPLRKLNPDYYGQLLMRMNKDRTANRSSVAA